MRLRVNDSKLRNNYVKERGTEVKGNKFYDREGLKLIEKYKQYSLGESNSRYGQPDVIWTHPRTGAKVFCGDHTSASSAETLKEHKIYNIINT